MSPIRFLTTTLLFCATLQAATTTATLTATASGTLSGTVYNISGTATMSGGLVVNAAPFTASIPASVTTGSGTFTAATTINNGGNTLVLNIAFNDQVFTAGSATGSASLTQATGPYSGLTGSFASLAGTSSLKSGVLTLNLSGSGSFTMPAPSISGIVNNYSYIPSGFPNYGIAPGALFVVTGKGLADMNAALALQSSTGAGIPLSLNGANITVTVNGVTTKPGLYYAEANQLAAVLPAGTPAGTGTLTVNYNNTSASSPITVVPGAMGIGTYQGLAIATDYTTFSLYTYMRSAKPGDTIVIWGSGLGANPVDSDTQYTGAPHAGLVPLQVYIGNQPANVVWYGDSVYPGVQFVSATIPPGVTPGCQVSLTMVSGSGNNQVASNTTAIPVSRDGGECSDPAYGTTGSQIVKYLQAGKVPFETAFLNVGIIGSTTAQQQVVTVATGNEFVSGAGAPPPLPLFAQASPGSCAVTIKTSATSPTLVLSNPGTTTVTYAGGSVTLTRQSDGTLTATVPVIPAGQTLTVNTPQRTPGPTFEESQWGEVVGQQALLAEQKYFSRLNGGTAQWSGAPLNSITVWEIDSTDPSGASASLWLYGTGAQGTVQIPPAASLGLFPGAGTLTVTTMLLDTKDYTDNLVTVTGNLQSETFDIVIQ